MPTKPTAANPRRSRRPASGPPRVGVSELLLLPLDQVLRLLEPRPERPKDVHALRVSIRRLRARLSAFRSLLGASRREVLDDGLAWLSDQLAPVREWDVIMADLPGNPPPRVKKEDLEDAVAERRRKALKLLHKSLAGKRALRLHRDLIGLRRLLSDGDPHAATNEQELLARSREAVARRLRKFKERYEEASKAGHGADALHRLRLEAKKLRYTLEMLQQACPDAPVEGPLETLVGLQDRLGAEQDAVVERQRLASLGKPFKMPRRKVVSAPSADAPDIAGACRRAMRQIRGIRIDD